MNENPRFEPSSAIPVEQDALSFSKSAEIHGESLTTRVEENALRPPLQDPDDPLWTQNEQQAHSALGLGRSDPFIVIGRIRILGGQPRAIHRAYLDPRRFPDSFLSDHDFAAESLIHIYNHYGYRLTSRDTTLMARIPSPRERIDLGFPMNSPVLGVEQSLFATDAGTQTPFILEFLHATYLNWRYEIKNRPPAGPAS